MKRKFDYILEDVYRELINAICANDESRTISLITNYPELIDKVNQGWYEPLFLAVEKGDLSIFKIMKQAKINLSAVDRGGENILHLAINNNKLDIIKYLLSIEQDLELLNTKDNDGHTALHVAAEVGNLEIIKLLLDAGADITAVNDDGENVLCIAINSNALEIVKYLLMQGLSINKSDEYIKTVNDLIGTSQDITKIFQNEKSEKLAGDYSSQENLDFAATFFIERFKTGTIKFDSFADIEKRISDNDLLNKQENLPLKNALNERVAEFTKDVIILLYMIEDEIINMDSSFINQKSHYSEYLSRKYNSNGNLTPDQKKEIENSLVRSLIKMFNEKEDGLNLLAQKMISIDIELKKLKAENLPIDDIYITMMINLKQNILSLQKYLLSSDEICSALNNVINSYNKMQENEEPTEYNVPSEEHIIDCNSNEELNNNVAFDNNENNSIIDNSMALAGTENNDSIELG